MSYSKPPTTVEAQADLLDERGLAFDDRAEVIRYLRAIGYYRLSAYWLVFEAPPPEGQTRSKTFPPGVRFQDVLDLYIFDRKLRLLVMEAIERIEVAVRSSWTNRLTLASGPHAHLDPDLFNSPWSHAAMVARLASAVQDSHETFITHYREKYASPYMPPLWAVTELMSLGELSRWFSATRSRSVRSAVAKDLALPSKEVLESTLQVFSLIRNVCAHHGRLWNRKLVKRLPTIKRLGADMVFDGGGIGGQVQKSIYNSLVVMLHILRAQSVEVSLPRRIAAHMETAKQDQRAAMGFPPDWRTRTIWGVS